MDSRDKFGGSTTSRSRVREEPRVGTACYEVQEGNRIDTSLLEERGAVAPARRTRIAQHWLLLAATLILLCGSVNAQERRVGLRGVVVDSVSGDPVAGATLSLNGRPALTETRRDGSFVFTAVSAPGERISVRKIGYEPMEAPVQAPSRDGWIDVGTIHISPISAALPAVVIRGGTRVRGEMAGFTGRAERGIGTFLSRGDIERHRFRRSSEILRTIPGLIVECRTGQCLVGFSRNRRPGVLDGTRTRFETDGGQGLGGDAPNEALSRVPSGSAPGRICPVAYYVDGMRFEGNLGIDEFPPEEIEAIELHKGPATTPMRFRSRGSTCGTIVIWTRAPN